MYMVVSTSITNVATKKICPECGKQKIQAVDRATVLRTMAEKVHCDRFVRIVILTDMMNRIM